MLVVGAGWHWAIWPLNQHSEVALQRRAQRYWDMKIAGRVDSAYDLMANIYRKRVAQEGFARSLAGPVVHLRATVNRVGIDGDEGDVQLRLEYVFNRPGFRDLPAVANVTERWVYENGGWYRWPPEG